MTDDAELEAIRRYVAATTKAADRALGREEVTVENQQLIAKALTSIVEALENLTALVERLQRQKR